MVYQFSLPPLLLDADSQAAIPVVGENWNGEVETAFGSNDLFQFHASHDASRPPARRSFAAERPLTRCAAIVSSTPRIRQRPNGDGHREPYELIITYLDASRSPRRCTRKSTPPVPRPPGVMLAMLDPAIYSIPSSARLGVSRRRGVGIPRRINPHKYTRSERDAVLADADSLQTRVMDGYRGCSTPAPTTRHVLLPQAAQEISTAGLRMDRMVRRCHCQGLPTDPPLIVLANLGPIRTRKTGRPPVLPAKPDFRRGA